MPPASSGIGAAHGDIAQGLRPGYGLLEIGEHAVEAIGCRLVGDLVEADFRAVELDAADLEALPLVAPAIPKAGYDRGRVGIEGARQERHAVLVLPGREGRDVAGGVIRRKERRHERVVGVGAEHRASHGQACRSGRRCRQAPSRVRARSQGGRRCPPGRWAARRA